MSDLLSFCLLKDGQANEKSSPELRAILKKNSELTTFTLEEYLIDHLSNEGTEINEDELKNIMNSLISGKLELSKINFTQKFASETTIQNLLSTDTTPLHLLYYTITKNSSQEIVSQLVEELLLAGCIWNAIDFKDNTPGCILNNKGLKNSKLYQQIVEAGVRSELLFKAMESGGLFGFDDDDDDDEVPELVDTTKNNEEVKNDPADDNKTYLSTKLSYTDSSLLTSNLDGVMMNWETPIMKLASETLFSKFNEEELNGPEEINILNIGFGMGIIDTFIQKNFEELLKNHPNIKFNHYIAEAHPDVLNHIKTSKFDQLPGVKILPGIWQESLAKLLDDGVFFTGIYYDTFSEHYRPDMCPKLFDIVVGLLNPHGVFSFFNGLGADRQISYDVYCKVVELDLEDYGLKVEYKEIPVNAKEEDKKFNNDSKDVWDGIKRSYWNCSVFYHPEITFQ